MFSEHGLRRAMMNWKAFMAAATVAGGVGLLGGQPAHADEASGSKVDAAAHLGNVSPSAGVTVCGNAVAVLHAHARGGCDRAQSTSSKGSGRAGDGAPREVDGRARIGNVSPSVGVIACGNSAAIAHASSSGACRGDGGTTGGESVTSAEREGADTGAASTDVELHLQELSPSARVMACGNAIAVLGGSALSSCGGGTRTASTTDPAARRGGDEHGDGPAASRDQEAPTNDVAGESSDVPTRAGDLVLHSAMRAPLPGEVLGEGFGGLGRFNETAPGGAGAAPLPLTGGSAPRMIPWGLLLLMIGSALTRREVPPRYWPRVRVVVNGVG
jgi:hypothetical protein